MLRLDRRGQAVLFGILVLCLGLAAALIGGLAVEPYGWIPLASAVLAILLCAGPGSGGGRDFSDGGSRDFSDRGGGIRSRDTWSGFAVGTAGWRAWAPAIAIPAVILTAGYVVAAVTGNATLSFGATNPAVFAVVTVAVVGAGSIEAIGEELGWRGYLLPRLVGLGRVRAGLVGGLLWMGWHVPLIYIAAAYHGGAGPLYMLPFGVTIVAMNFVANELRMASGSSWPAVVFHGAHNGIWYQLGVLTVGHSGLLAGIGDESGVVPMTLYALVAVWIILRRPAWTAPPRPSA